MATIRDVAKLAGVGVGTVSRVLSGNGSVSEKTCQRVTQAITELRYRPSSIARSLSSKSQNIIGLWLPHFLGPFNSKVMSLIEHEMRKHGKHLVATSGKDYLSEFSPLYGLEFLIERDCDGIIISGYGMSDFDLAQILTIYPNLVLLNRSLADIEEQCFDIDHQLGGHLAAQYFIDKGHQKFACITGPKQDTLDAKQRFVGFQQTLEAHGYLLQREHIATGEYEFETGYDGIEILLKSGKAFTALFCGNDLIAMGAMAKLNELQISVPDEIALIGYDDSDFAQYTIPSLTSVNMPIEQATIAACHKILNLCYDHSFDINTEYRPELKIRKSSG